MVDILYEDKALLVCKKPAGIAVQTASATQKDLESELKNYLAAGQKGIPYLGVVHRLDQPVEGILVFAKTKEAMASLSSQVQAQGGMHKEYLARVYGQLPQEKGSLEDWLRKDGRNNRSEVVPKGSSGAKQALLDYEKLEQDEETQLLRICLHTGRHHQIRVQLAHCGVPILGDRRYGSPAALAYADGKGIRRLCLAACALEFCHPVSGEKLQFREEISFF